MKLSSCKQIQRSPYAVDQLHNGLIYIPQLLIAPSFSPCSKEQILSFSHSGIDSPRGMHRLDQRRTRQYKPTRRTRNTFRDTRDTTSSGRVRCNSFYFFFLPIFYFPLKLLLRAILPIFTVRVVFNVTFRFQILARPPPSLRQRSIPPY